MTINLLTFTVK